METINANEFIILRLPPVAEAILFIYTTFGIMQYVLYDDRFPAKQLGYVYRDKFQKANYDDFREKCLLIDKEEISFTINEYVFLAKTIDFVSKYFIGEHCAELKSVMTDDFKDKKDFDFKSVKDFYLKTATTFFNNFKESCSNEDLLAKINEALNWEIDI